MEKHNLEEYFNRRISDHSEFIDKDELWNDLGLEKKKKRRGILWLWGGLAIVLLVVSVFIFNMNPNPIELVDSKIDFNDTNSSVLKSNDTQSYTRTKKIDSAKVENDRYEVNSTINSKSNRIIIENKIVQISDVDTNQKKNIKNDKTVENNLDVNLHINNEPTEKTLDKESLIIEDEESSLIENLFTKRENIDQNVKIDVRDKELEFRKNENLKSGSTSKIQQQIKSEYPKIDDERVSSPNIGVDKGGAIKKENETESVDEESKNVSIVGKEISAIVEDNDVIYNNEEVISGLSSNLNQAKVSLFHLGIYADASLIDRNLYALQGSFDTLTHIRNASEKTLERIGFGAYLKYQTPSGFYAKLGANYTSLNTELKARIISEGVETTDSFPLTIILKEDGDTIASNFGTFEERVLLDQSLTIYTSHKIIDIPLSLGYRFSLGKWGMFAEIRPSMSIHHSYRGRIYNGVGLIDGNRYVDTSTKFSLGTAIGLSYNMNDTWNVWLQPYYQTSFNSYMDSRSGQNEAYQFYGLRLGTEMQF